MLRCRFHVGKLVLLLSLLAFPSAWAGNLAEEKEFLRLTMHGLGVTDDKFSVLWEEEERGQQPLSAELATFAREREWPPRLLAKIDYIVKALSEGKEVTRRDHTNVVKHLCMQTLALEDSAPDEVAVPMERDADADEQAQRSAKRKRAAQDAEEKVRDDQLLQFVRAIDSEYGKLPPWAALTTEERRTFKFLCSQIKPYYQDFWIRQILTAEQAGVVRNWVREIQPLRWRLIVQPEAFMGRAGFTHLTNTYFNGNRERAQKAATRALTPDEYLQMHWDDKFSRKRLETILARFAHKPDEVLPFRGNLGFLRYVLAFTEGDPFAAKLQVKAALSAADVVKLEWPANTSDHTFSHVRYELKWRLMLLTREARGQDGLQRMADEFVYKSKAAGPCVCQRVSRLARTLLTHEEYLALNWPDSIEQDEKIEIHDRFFPLGSTVNADYIGSAGLARYALEFHQGNHAAAQLRAPSCLSAAEQSQLGWPKVGQGPMDLVISLRAELLNQEGKTNPRYYGVFGFTKIPGKFSKRGKDYLHQLLRDALSPEELIALNWPDFPTNEKIRQISDLATVGGKIKPIYAGVSGLARYAIDFTEGDPDGARRQVLLLYGATESEHLKWPKAPPGIDSMLQTIGLRRLIVDETATPRSGTQNLEGMKAKAREARALWPKLTVTLFAANVKLALTEQEYRLLQWPDSHPDAPEEMGTRLFSSQEPVERYLGKEGMARYAREFTQGDPTAAALQVKASLTVDQLGQFNWPSEKKGIDEVRILIRLLTKILDADQNPKKEYSGADGLAALRKEIKGNTPKPIVEMARQILMPDQFAALAWPNSVTEEQLGPILRGLFSGERNLEQAEFVGELGLARFALAFTAGDPDMPRQQALYHLTDGQRAKLNWPERPSSHGRERVKFIIATRRQLILSNGSINPDYRGERGRNALIGQHDKIGEIRRRTEGISGALSNAEFSALVWPEILTPLEIATIRNELLLGIGDESGTNLLGLLHYSLRRTGGNPRKALNRARIALRAEEQIRLNWPELNDETVRDLEGLVALRRSLIDEGGKVRTMARQKEGLAKLLGQAVAGLPTTEEAVCERAQLVLNTAEYKALQWPRADIPQPVTPARQSPDTRPRFFSADKLNSNYCGSAGAARYALVFTDGDFIRASKQAKGSLNGPELEALGWPPPPMVQVIAVRGELMTKDQMVKDEYKGDGGLEKLTEKRWGHSNVRERDIMRERAQRGLTVVEFEQLGWEKPADDAAIATFRERLLVDGEPRPDFMGTPGLARYALEHTDGDAERSRSQAVATFEEGIAKMHWPAKPIRFIDRLEFLVEVRRKLLRPDQSPKSEYRGVEGWLVFAKANSPGNWRRDRYVFRQRAYEVLTPVEYQSLDWEAPPAVGTYRETASREPETCAQLVAETAEMREATATEGTRYQISFP